MTDLLARHEVSVGQSASQRAKSLLGAPISLLADRTFDLIFSVFILSTIFLLGGTIYGVNFYSPFCAALFPLALYSLFYRGRARLTSLVLTLVVPITLAIWGTLGLSHGFELASAKPQFTDILLTFYPCWLAFVFCGQDEEKRIGFLRLVLFSITAAAAAKVGLILYAVARGIPVIQMVLLLEKIFGGDLMTMSLGDLIGRVQFGSDALIPLAVFIVLRHRERLRIKSFVAALMVLLLLASVLFSFSRYYWGFASAAFVLGLVLGKRDKFQIVLASVMGLSILVSLPSLIALYQLRFSGVVAGGSDVQRAEQIPALEDFFMSAPLLGHGLGSYTFRSVRGTTEAGSYNYEVQLLALPAQIGLAGILLLLCLAGWYYEGLLWQSRLRLADRLGIVLLLVFWIGAGFSNPLLFNAVAGIIYATFRAVIGLPTLPPEQMRRLPNGLATASPTTLKRAQ